MSEESTRGLSSDDIRTIWADALTIVDQPDVTIKVDVTQKSRAPDDVSETTSSVSSRLNLRSHDIRQPGAPGGPSPHYELLQQLGEGGMGIVYRARQTSVDRTVALKLIKDDYQHDQRSQSGFLSEAAATACLDHPNIVPIYDAGTGCDGTVFYAMKEVRGTEWKSVIGEKSKSENLEILMRVADAVAFAHSKGVIHRDLKPENVMLGDFGEVLVMDWGLAAAVTDEGKADKLDSDNALGGTPAYMAPEMAVADMDRIGKCSDIYLLGGILFEIVTGKRPHVGPTVTDCLVSAADNVIQETDEEGELLDISMKAMATDPEDRHQEVRDFQKALRDYQSHAESIRLTEAAHGRIAKAAAAEASAMHGAYSDAIAIYKEALSTWSENKDAREGLQTAHEAFAEAALAQGDLGLAKAQVAALEAEGVQHGGLAQRVDAAIKARTRRDRIAKYSRIGTIAAVLTITVVSLAAYVITDKARRAAEKAQAAEKEQRLLVQKEKDAAEEARDAESKQREAAEASKREAEAAQQAEAEQRKIAEANLAKAEQENYYNAIALADAKIADCLIEQAQDLLWNTPTSMRHFEWGKLLLDTDLSLMTIPVNAAWSIMWSSEGKKILVGDRRGKLCVLDALTGSKILSIQANRSDKPVFGKWSPDGSKILSMGDDKIRVAKVWNANTGAELFTLREKDSSIYSVDWSPDSKKIVTGSIDGVIRVWDAATSSELRILWNSSSDGSSTTGFPTRGPAIWVYSVDWSPDGKKILAVMSYGPALVLDAESGNKLLAICDGANSATWSPDGKKIAIVDIDQPVKILNAANGKELLALEGHSGRVNYGVWSPDGKRIVTASDDRSAKVWDAETGFELFTLRGHYGTFHSPVWSPDGKRIASGGFPNTIKIWDAENGGGVLSLDGHKVSVNFAAWSPDGKKIVTQTSGMDASVYDANIGKVLFFGRHAPQCNGVTLAAWSPDGKKIVAREFVSEAKVVDLETGKALLTLEGDTGHVTSATWSPDGKRIATGTYGKAIDVWDAETGRQIVTLQSSGYNGRPVAWSPDSKKIMTVNGSDKSVVVWDAGSGNKLLTLDCNFSRGPSAAEWSRDGKMIITLNSNGKVWNAETGKELFTCDGNVSRVSNVMWSPDSKRILARGQDKTAKVWDVERGKEDLTLEGHSEYLCSAEWSPDAKRIVTGSSDKTARIWDAKTGRELVAIKDIASIVSFAVWSPDGKRLVAGGDKTANIWEAVPWDTVTTKEQYEEWRRKRYQEWLKRHGLSAQN